MSKVRVNGTDIHYDTYGTGQAVLGLHGTPSAAAVWAEAGADLGRFCRCVIPDRRGFGRSAEGLGPGLDLDDHITDAVELLTMLDAAPAIVIGRSTGGLIALALAERHPELVGALVLLEPGVFAVHDAAQGWANSLRAAVLEASALDPAQAAKQVFDFALGPEVWPTLSPEAQDLFTSGSEGVLAEIRGIGLDLSERPYHPADAQLRALHVPTLIVTGTDSIEACRLVDEHLDAVLPDVRHVSVEGSHLISPAAPPVLDFVIAMLARSSN